MFHAWLTQLYGEFMGDVVRRVLQNKSIVLGDHYRANPIIVARLSERCNKGFVVFENVIRLLFC